MDDISLINRELARRELARRRYSDYLAYTNGPTWIRTKFADYLANQIEAFVEEKTGNAYDILIINSPPQHGKSMNVTEAAPSYFLGRHPDWRVILASYNDETAERFARRNKEKVRDHGESLFGIKIGDINRATEFELAAAGGAIPGRLISRGILSGITGNPANLLFIDDPIKNRSEADSPTKRQQIWNEWLNSLKSRLAAGAKVIVIMTPWHEDDLSARMLATENNIRQIRLPVEAEMDDPLGREEGDPLCPELGKDKKWLQQFKESYMRDPEGGPRAWSALYQCNPRVEGGNLVKREWWKFYDPKEVTMFGTELISVDATFKGGEDNDYVAITVWGKLNNDYYCRYCLRRHMDFPQTVEAIRAVKRLYPRANAVLIEDKANGSAIIQTLQREMFCIGVNPKGGKEARINAISPAIESGHVFLPIGAAWVVDFIDEFTAFPAGKHDDMCFAAGTMVATQYGDRPIETIRPGEKVWTPFGLCSVTWAGQTGVSETVTRMGLTGTPTHPVFDRENNTYSALQNLTGRVHCDIISLKGVLSWKYRKLLYLTAWNTGSWEAVDITLVNRVQMKDDAMRKDFMWRFGNFIRGRQFLRAMKFTTRTATLLITTLATWSVYRCGNTASSIASLIRRNKSAILNGFRTWRRDGTPARKDEHGTGHTSQTLLEKSSHETVFANSAEKHSKPGTTPMPDSALTTALLCGTTTTKPERSAGSVTSAAPSSMQSFAPEQTVPEPAAEPAVLSSKQKSITRTPGDPCLAAQKKRPVRSAARPLNSWLQTIRGKAPKPAGEAAPQSCDGRERNLNKRPVYNLTVAENHLFYAGGFLVHNCDSTSQALTYMLYSSGEVVGALPPSEEETPPIMDADWLDGDRCYDVYGGW